MVMFNRELSVNLWGRDGNRTLFTGKGTCTGVSGWDPTDDEDPSSPGWSKEALRSRRGLGLLDRSDPVV